MKLLISILLGLFCVVAFAQGVSPAPSPAALPVVDNISKWLAEHMVMALVGLGFAIEMLLRLVPTAKPQSLLIWVSSALKSVSNLLTVLSQYADKLVQNTKG